MEYVAGVVTVEKFAEEHQRRIVAGGMDKRRKRKLEKLIAK